jgi:hypothetical protein
MAKNSQRHNTMQGMAFERLRLPVLAFGVIAAFAVALSRIKGSWEELSPDPCRRVDCYCEIFHRGLVIQPVNTYSNLGLILVGLLAGLSGDPLEDKGERRNQIPGKIRFMYGMTLLAAGFGSLFYHASLSRVGEWTDLVGIYLYLSFLLLYNLWRTSGARPFWLAIAFLGINLLLGAQMIIARELQQVVIGGLATGTIILEAFILLKKRSRGNLRLANPAYLAAALGCFALGGSLWALGERLLPCIPGKTFPPHAAWHLLAAAGTAFYFLYYRSEWLASQPRISHLSA